jgi:alpha-galactosidase
MKDFSFVYGDRHSSEFLHTWKYEVEDRTSEKNICMKTHIFSDADTGLEVKVDVKEYTDTPAFDWTVYFTNKGSKNTPVIKMVRPLDLAVTPQKKKKEENANPAVLLEGLMFAQNNEYTPDSDDLPVLSRIKGSVGCTHFSYDEFQPIQTNIKKGDKHTFGSEKYNSSYGDYTPFFEISWSGGGVVSAIGWSGKWTACVEGLEDGNIRVSSGMSDLNTYLLPGETIRTPRIMQVYWEGNNPDTGYNKFRQVMIKHILPRNNGELVFPPIASPCILENLAANEANQAQHITKDMEGLGFEVYWLDAWWHKKGFPQGMGNYSFPIETPVDFGRFPNGMKYLSDLAHERGYKFLLWFAPETVNPDNTMIEQYPQWILTKDLKAGGTFNLGIPEACEYMKKFMDSCIKQWGVDIWRTDSGPADFSAFETDPERLGMLELRYYEGFYELWDYLLSQNPGLMIDNCCGGGTRIDLETSARSISLWRTDSSVWTIGSKEYTKTAVINELINTSLNRYVPFSQSGAMSFEPYYIRGGFNGGLTYYEKLPDREEDRKMMKQAVSECKKLRKYLTGDFYRLFTHTEDYREWCVYQYDLADDACGVIIALRRIDSPFGNIKLEVRGIEPEAEYQVDYYETYELLKTVKMKGTELQKLCVEINTAPGNMMVVSDRSKLGPLDTVYLNKKPGSMLIEYTKL